MQKIKKTIIGISLLLLQASVFSNDYYVSKSGLDTNLGTEASPYLTITKATDAVKAGDTVFIKAGIYKERVVLKTSGTATSWITIRNYAQDSVTIDGQGISWWAWNGLFDISENKAFITVSGLRLINSTFAGFFIDGSHDITIKNSSSYNTFSSGIGVWNSDTIVIDNNEVELACNDGPEESITVAGSSHSIIKNNEVHHNGPGTVGGEGIDVKDGSHDVSVSDNHVHHLNNRIGIYVDAWDKLTANIDIYNNRVHHCTDTGIAVATEMGGPLLNVSVFNNIAYANKYGGIEVGDWVADAAIVSTPINDIEIINNTLFNNGDGIIINNADATNITVRNNILSQNIGSQYIVDKTPAAQVTADHNMIDGCRNTAKEICGPVSLQLDPLFTDSANNNFSLKNNSPAIDAGSALLAPLTDFKSRTRPINGLWDIGAYEFISPVLGVSPILILLLEDESE